MYTTEVKIRVRYGETDRMGYVYYGNYAEYFEVARVESLRNLGFSYKKLDFTTYVFNPNDDDRTVVIAVGVRF